MFDSLTREENDQLEQRLSSAAGKYYRAFMAVTGTSLVPGIMGAWRDNTDARRDLTESYVRMLGV